MKLRRVLVPVALVFLTSCAGGSKFCSQFNASAFGTDWLVVQFAQDGRPFNCWKLHDAAVDSGQGGNIDWKDTATGHLIHITGWENRIQVANGDFHSAAQLLGIDETKCLGGAYR